MLEFDSDRKRMSVIVKNPRGDIRVVTKGAEVTLLPKCQDNTKTSVLQTTLQHINQFAGEGLRTLAVAVKTLTPEDYQEFAQSCLVPSFPSFIFAHILNEFSLEISDDSFKKTHMMHRTSCHQ